MDERTREPTSIQEIDDLLDGPISKAWDRCMPIWRSIGRVEDKPKGWRFPRYLPRGAKVLGERFAERYFADFAFVVEQLAIGEDISKVCAFEILEYMTEFPSEDERERFFKITLPIPGRILSEIRSDHIYKDFSGASAGEYFAWMYRR